MNQSPTPIVVKYLHNNLQKFYTIMLKSVPHFHSSSLSRSPHLQSRSDGGSGSGVRCPRLDSMTCFALRDYSGIPYLGTFSKPRGMYDDFLDKLPVIDKARLQLSDYCTTLEGEPCFDCWMAVFDLNYLSHECGKEEVEKMVRGASGNKHLIEDINEMVRAHKMKKELGARTVEDDNKTMQKTISKEEELSEIQKPVKKKTMMTFEERAEKLMEEKGIRVPDGVIPPTWEELEEMERRNTPDSSYGRLLRYIGGYPSWYVARPDHETD